jgi:hypothetical protein
MKSKHNLPIKVISIIVLFFFCWTFCICEIPNAFANNESTAGNKQLSSQSSSQTQTSTPKPEEKFQKSIDEIESILVDTSTDTDTKKNKLKGKKSEIESLDVEIKKQFAETEKKLKDEGLPNEILDRHYNFVKSYEDNLNELKNNLDAIEKHSAKSKELSEAIDKTKKFLEKVKPPKKYVPLDPNKLPHRTAEPVWIEPRTSPEQFLKDSSQYTVASSQGKTNRQNILKARQIPLSPSLLKGDLGGLPDNDPVLVASAGSLNGLLNSPIPDPQSQNSVLLAFADPPTDADLAETIEVKFTPAIQAKATELGHNPTKIYNWVRNNIEFVPTYGSIQGADYCLQTKQCNSFDTASLLIALLRSSGIHARYVQGTIELPIEKVKNWVGGFTDSMEALRLLASAKIPTKGMTVGGEIKYARIEHVYVEAWIDYIPSRGEIHKQGDTWIPLDASFKQYNYTQGIDIKSAVPFDAQSFIDQLKSTATVNETEGYVTNVNSLFIQQTMQDYQTQVQNYITQNYPNATVGDVLGKKEIIKQEFPILAGTLPYKLIVKGATYSSIPENLRHKITFNVVKDMYDEIIGTPINITKSLPELAGKKITLSYSPATSADEAVINSYLPKPHTDGTPIDPSELPTSLPAYLINLKPELRMDSVVVATGTFVGMGNTETFKMTFTAPNESADVITNDVQAGEYLGIALDPGRISQEQMQTLKAKLEATKAKLEAQDFSNLTKDDILGDLLYTTALSYYAELDVMDYVSSNTMGVAAIRLPSETIFSFELRVDKFLGSPLSVSSGGLSMDVDRAMTLIKAFNGNKEKPRQFMLASGANGSALEYSVPEQLFSTPDDPAQGISAVKALKIANDQEIPIYTINQTNINTILPQLQVDGDVKGDIQNAVSAGKEVTVSKTNITFNGWTGCGYIIIDPSTGAGAYMISGSLNGSIIKIMQTIYLIISIIIGVAIALTFGFWIGIIGTIIASAYFTLIKKLLNRDPTLSLADVLLFLTEVITWTALGAGIAAAAAVSGIAGLIVAIMLIFAVVLLELIIAFTYRMVEIIYANTSRRLIGFSV